MSTVSEVLSQLSDQLERNLSHTSTEFGRIRAGKASVGMLDGVMVEAYGAMMPLSGAATVSTPDARTLSIQPWDRSLIQAIETAIINSNLGFAPQNDGMNIRINVPQLTEERRKELVKRAKNEAENSKIGIRNLRKDANERIKKLKNDGLSEDEAKVAEADIQKMVDGFIKKTEDLLVGKEKEIMTV
ncbi:MAG: ribosome recycling factor [Bacteroidia bacterium]